MEEVEGVLLPRKVERAIQIPRFGSPFQGGSPRRVHPNRPGNRSFTPEIKSRRRLSLRLNVSSSIECWSADEPGQSPSFAETPHRREREKVNRFAQPSRLLGPLHGEMIDVLFTSPTPPVRCRAVKDTAGWIAALNLDGQSTLDPIHWTNSQLSRRRGRPMRPILARPLLALSLIGLIPILAGAQDGIVSWGWGGAGLSNTPSGTGYTHVAGGQSHSLALDATGTIVSWGSDAWGQQSNTPSGTGFTQVAAGSSHSLALDASGSIVSWGRDDLGQVSGTPSGTGFTQIAGSATYHSLALTANGSIVGWGHDIFGQVSGAPSGTGFTQVAGGGHHSLALSTSSSIVSWGKDDFGQVSTTPTGTGFTEVIGGFAHSLALVPYTPPAPFNFGDYWPVAAGYSWKGVSPGCPDPCACPALELWEVQGPAAVVPTAFLVGPTGSTYSAVLENTGSDFIYYGFYDSSTYLPAIGGPHHLGNTLDGDSFQTDSVEKILVRDWDLITDPNKAQYGIPSGLDVVVWINYDLQVPFSGNLHHDVMESGVPLGTTIPQGSITGLTWFVKGDGLYASMDIDASSGAPLPPVLDTEFLASLDCNGNGIFDHLDISSGSSADLNLDCIPDECVGSGVAYCFGDGSGSLCPCLANGSANEGCANSSGIGGATLGASGNPSIAGDTFQLQVLGVPGNKPGLILRGANQLNGGFGNPFGDGLLCVAGQTARSQVQVTSAGATTFTNFQGQPFGQSSYGVGVPTNYQLWYRDAANACSGAGFNFTNAWAVTWLP